MSTIDRGHKALTPSINQVAGFQRLVACEVVKLRTRRFFCPRHRIQNSGIYWKWPLLYINDCSFIRVSRGSEGVWKGLGHDI